VCVAIVVVVVAIVVVVVLIIMQEPMGDGKLAACCGVDVFATG
jgi:preprotein translocase subunit SecG